MRRCKLPALVFALLLVFGCSNDSSGDGGDDDYDGLSVSEAAVYVRQMTASETVYVSDSVNGEGLWDLVDALHALYESSPDVRVTLDFSGMKKLTYLARGAFASCYALKAVVLPDTLATINGAAFYDCENLTKVSIPDTCTSISSSAFHDCKSLKSITIPSDLEYLAEYTFYGCTSLVTVNFPDQIQEIASYAFQDCTALSSVTLPKWLGTLQQMAFKGCTALSKVTFDWPDDYYIGDEKIDVTDPSTNATNLKNDGTWFEKTISRKW